MAAYVDKSNESLCVNTAWNAGIQTKSFIVDFDALGTASGDTIKLMYFTNAIINSAAITVKTQAVGSTATVDFGYDDGGDASSLDATSDDFGNDFSVKGAVGTTTATVSSTAPVAVAAKYLTITPTFSAATTKGKVACTVVFTELP